MTTRRDYMTGLLAASPQLDKIFSKLGKKSSAPSDDVLARGLKEALTVGTDSTVGITGRTDGFFKNQAIKILLPEPLRPVERGLRLIGQQGKVDELILGMNRAAEKAAPMAKPVFRDAILSMTFDDARKIFTGGDTAATDYFKAKTLNPLTTAFRPPVADAMRQVGVVKQYDNLLATFQKIPFAKTEMFDLESYVVKQSLSGLFLVLGQEEKKIRTDPAAQVTALLKQVFGGK
jgi:hypothetical protein